MENTMRIAVETHALSQDNITGVGNVILHYLNELQKIDAANEYFIYVMDDLKHLAIRNPRWRYVDFNYGLKRLRMSIRNRWLQLKSEGGTDMNILLSSRILLFRLSKIMLELFDEVVFSLKLASSLRKYKIDIYVGTSTYYYPYFFFSTVKKIGFLYDLVWKLYPETMEFGNKARMKLLTFRNMRKLDLLVSISANTKNDAHELLNLNTRIEAIPLAADGTIFYPADGSTVSAVRKKYGISKKYILSVCTLEPRKNLKTLLAAYRILPSRREYQLVLVGMTGWIGSDFFQAIESSDVRDNVLITGYVSTAELAPIYTGAELFVFPTLYEGFGLPVLEAMQCGCPVITSNTSSIPEVAGDAALMLDPEDMTGLAESMEKILKNASLRKELAKKGLRQSKLFSWEKSARRLLQALESLR
ncbi:MAG: hypothetical protein A2176_14430 [Spirochaetes bacterium RBG_13_51_14]|nr:MAG: hypothetical protein A2176_14430 [Spirochaetes bacterium RBG_13_51_14]